MTVFPYYYIIKLLDSFVDCSRPPAQAKASGELGAGLRVCRRDILKTSKGLYGHYSRAALPLSPG